MVAINFILRFVILVEKRELSTLFFPEVDCSNLVKKRCCQFKLKSCMKPCQLSHGN